MNMASAEPLNLTWVFVLIIVVLLVSIYKSNDQVEGNGVYVEPSLWYIGSWRFFLKPYEFIEERLRQLPSEFMFRVMNNTAVVLRGAVGRDAFFSPGMNLTGGNLLLNPMVGDLKKLKARFGGEKEWSKFVYQLFSPDACSRNLPVLLKEAKVHLDSLEASGVIDLERELHLLTTKLFIRTTICHELCDDEESFTTLIDSGSVLSAGTDPKSLIFPWFPTPARISRWLAGSRLYSVIQKIVTARQGEHDRKSDLIQELLDRGLSPPEITLFVISIYLIGVPTVTSAVTALLVYMQTQPEWMERVQADVKAFAATHANTGKGNIPFANTSLSDWDKASPNLDQCISETLRLTIIGGFLRQTATDTPVRPGLTLSKGTFALFPSAELHLNPTYYPSPDAWDPTRWTPEAVKERSHHGLVYLGFGAGRHPCLGKHFAMLVTRVIVVLLFHEFEFQIVDETTCTQLVTVPEMTRYIDRPRVPKEKVYFQYERRIVEPVSRA
ncbi:cytochrome P450 [Panus rudis PR-1116 ss-1]|nr:cytochrome P450 [Panus rudis PR-1116 ss-1]